MTSDLSPDDVDPAVNAVPAADSGRHSVARNLVAMMSSQAVSWLLGLVSQIVQPRFLGPEGLGQIQLAFSLWIVAQVFVSMGTGVYLTLEMARDRQRGAKIVGPIIVLRLGAYLLAALAMAAYAAIVGLNRTMIVLLAITGVTMLINVIQDVFASAIVGLEQMGYVSIATVASKFLYTIVMVIVLTSGGGVVALAVTTIVQAVLAITFIAYFYRRLEPVTFARPADGYRSILRAGSGFMVNGIVLTLYMQVDMVVMSLLVDEDALGWYTSADVLTSSMLFIPSLLLIVLFPVFGRLYAADESSIQLLLHRAFWVLTLSGVAVGFGMAVIAEPFSVLLFGEDFRETGDVLAVLGLSAPLIFTTMLLGQVCMASGREGFWNRLMGVAVVISVAFDFVFVPIMDRATGNGAVAGALGYVVTESMMVVVAVRKISPELFSGPNTIKICKIVTAGALMFVASWPVREQFLLVPIVVGAVVFVASVFVLRILSEDDRYLLGKLTARIPVLRNRSAAPATEPPVEVADHSAGDDDPTSPTAETSTDDGATASPTDSEFATDDDPTLRDES